MDKFSFFANVKPTGGLAHCHTLRDIRGLAGLMNKPLQAVFDFPVRLGAQIEPHFVLRTGELMMSLLSMWLRPKPVSIPPQDFD
jgi:hypothetical protein